MLNCSIFVTDWFLVLCAKLVILGVKLINFELVVFVRYTLWNAEYRMSLTRNLEMSHGDGGSDCETTLESLEVKDGGEEHGEIEKAVSDLGLVNSETYSSSSSSSAARVFEDLPPQALEYIQQLQSELSNMKEVILLLIFLFSSHFCCYDSEVVTVLFQGGP